MLTHTNTHLDTFLRDLAGNPPRNLSPIARTVPLPIKYGIMRLIILYFWITDFIHCRKDQVSVLHRACLVCLLIPVCVFVFRVWLEQRVIKVLLGIPVQRWASKMSPEHKNGDSKFLFLFFFFFKSFQGQPGPSGEPGPPVSISSVWPHQPFCQDEYDCSYRLYRYEGFVMLNLRLPFPVGPIKPLALIENPPMSLFWPLMNKNSLSLFW